MIRVKGFIPIHIYPIFWVLSFAIALLNSSSILQILIWIGIIFISVLIHEYGHALTAVFFGQKAHIDLLGFGGLTHRHGKKLKKWQDFLVVLNGPLFGFLLCSACYFLFQLVQPSDGSVSNYILKSMIFINLFWTVLNLLPIQPLDGGHLLNILLEGIFGLKGLKIGLFISIILAACMTLIGFLTQQIFIGIIFFMFMFENYRLFKNSLPMTDSDQNTVLQNMLKNAQKELSLGNLEGAISEFEHIREISKSGVTYLVATESMAEALDQLGKYSQGFLLLEPLSHKLKPESLLLLQKLAFHSNEWKTAAKTGIKAYQFFPGYEVALINALSYSMLHEEGPAIGWLQCAIRDGLPNIKSILEKQEFDPIRNNTSFQEIVHRF
ncbi:MAG TPA: site-2 protease family protein [Parachlamydiaceae bacterium]|nr:site-2 protease family protein [Parachlamydiaceae bacterium]